MATNSLPGPAGTSAKARSLDIPLTLSELPQAPDAWAELEATAHPVSQRWLAVIADRAASAAGTADTAGLERLTALLRRVDARLAAHGEDDASTERFALRAVTEVIGALRDRLVFAAPAFTADSEVGRLLLAIHSAPGASNDQLATTLHVDASQVSRAGRRLTQVGLAHPARQGRLNAWTLTPRGHRAAQALTPTAAQPVSAPTAAALPPTRRSTRPRSATQGATPIRQQATTTSALAGRRTDDHVLTQAAVRKAKKIPVKKAAAKAIRTTVAASRSN